MGVGRNLNHSGSEWERHWPTCAANGMDIDRGAIGVGRKRLVWIGNGIDIGLDCIDIYLDGTGVCREKSVWVERRIKTGRTGIDVDRLGSQL